MLLLALLAGSMLLGSCGGSAESSVENATENSDKSQVSKFALPSKLRDAPLPEEGDLSAVLRTTKFVDNLPDETFSRDLTIVGENAEIRLDDLSAGTYIFEVFYVFSHPVFGDAIELASAARQVVIEPRDNRINFVNGDFSTDFDDDLDGVSNLDELVSGRNPSVNEEEEDGEDNLDEGDEELGVEPEEAVTVLIDLPNFIAISELPEGSLRGLLTVNDAAAEEMTLNAEQARLELDGLSTGPSRLSLLLEFSHAEYGDGIRVAETGDQTVELVEGNNTVVFAEQDYNTEIDSDNDGFSNLEELVSNRNPRVAEDTTLPVATLLFPPTTTTVTYDNTVVVRGIASDDDSGVSEVSVNGVAASSDDDFLTWTATVPLELGATSLSVEVSDNVGNRNTDLQDIATVRRVSPVKLQVPKDIVFDNRQNRALITDTALRGIVAIDLSSGEHTMFSDGATPSSAAPFLSPESLVIDPVRGRVLVVDTALEALVAADLRDGERSILSDDISGGGDIAIDPTNLRVLLTDYAEGGLIEVDLDSGETSEREVGGPFPLAIDIEVRADRADRALVLNEGLTVNSVGFLFYRTSTISSNEPPLFAEPLLRPVDITMDYVNERALVVDQGHRSITAVDLASGDREFVSSPTSPNLQNPFFEPLSIAIDADNNRGLVVDSAWNRLFSVDLRSGERELISNHSTPNSRLPLLRPSEITYDDNNRRLVLVDAERSTVYNVDIDTAQRTHASFGSATSGPEVPDPAPVDIVFRNGQRDAYVLDAQEGAIYLFSNVVQTLLSGQDAGVSLSAAEDLAIDIAGNRLFVSDSESRAIVAVDLDTGQRSVFSDNSANVVTPFISPSELVFDVVNNRLFVVDNGADKIFSIDVNSGNRRLITNFVDSESGLALENITDVTLDLANNRLVILDNIGNQVIALALDSRQPSLLSGAVSANIFRNASGVFVDSEKNWAYVSDEGAAAVFVVDLTTGERLIFSQ